MPFLAYYTDCFPSELRTLSGNFESILSRDAPSINTVRILSEQSSLTVNNLLIGAGGEAVATRNAFVDYIRATINTLVSDFPNFSEEEIEIQFGVVAQPQIKEAVEVLIDRLFRRSVITNITDLDSSNAALSNGTILSHFGDKNTDKEFLNVLSSYFIKMATVCITANSNEYRVKLRIVEEVDPLTDGEPMIQVPVSGATVVLQDLDEFDPLTVVTEYGISKTNSDGYCDFRIQSMVETPDLETLVYAPGDDLSGTPTDLLAAVSSSVDLSTEDTFTFVVSLPVVSSTSLTLSNLFTDDTTFTTGDKGKFNSTYGGSATLETVRLAGGAMNDDRLTAASDGGKQRLDSYAMLELLNGDHLQNRVLIDNGYTSIHSVASMDREAFVASIPSSTIGYDDSSNPAEFINESGVAEVHAAAKSANAVIGSVIAAGLASRNTASKVAAIADALPKKCGCEDCQSGVSPLAYLADLINYTLGHVKNGSAMVSLSDLMSKLHQELPNIPATCSEVDNRMCQARIVTEVLARYHANGTTSGNYYSTGTWSTAFDTDHADYQKKSYELLLNYLGTSSEEVRRTYAEPAGSDRRLRLSERLGIPEFYDPAGTNLDTINALRFPSSGSASSKDDWLESMFGFRRFDRTPFGAAPATPTIETWKKDRLSSLWTELDHPEDEFHGALATLPIIDPDIIGPDDLKVRASGNVPYDLYSHRADWVQSSLADLESVTFQRGVYSGTRTVVVYGEDLTGIITLNDTLTIASASRTVEKIEFLDGNTHIKLDSITGITAGTTFTLTREETILTSETISSATLFHLEDVDLRADFYNQDGALDFSSLSADLLNGSTTGLTLVGAWFDATSKRTKVLCDTTVAGPHDGHTLRYNKSITIGGRTLKPYAQRAVVDGSTLISSQTVLECNDVDITALFQDFTGTTLPNLTAIYTRSGVEEIVTIESANVTYVGATSKTQIRLTVDIGGTITAGDTLDFSVAHVRSQNLEQNAILSLQNLGTTAIDYRLAEAFELDASSTVSMLKVVDFDLEDFIDNPMPAGVSAIYVDEDTPAEVTIATPSSVSFGSGLFTINMSSNLSGIATNDHLEVGVSITPWSGVSGTGTVAERIAADFSESGLIQDLKYGTAAEIEAANVKLELEYNLTVDEFTRLYEVTRKQELNQQNPENEAVTLEELRELNDIILAVVKKELADYWITEEQLNEYSINLNPKDFVYAIKEPGVGNWPLLTSSGEPVVDPSLIEYKDLPDFAVDGFNARTLFDARKTELESNYGTLKADREANGMDTMLKNLWVGSNDYDLPGNVADLETLRDNLSSGNPFVVAQAEWVINNIYLLDIESFEKVITAKVNSEDLDPSNWPTSEEYNAVYDILVTSQKLRKNYGDSGTWLIGSGQENSQAYYQLRKARLPKWRASFATRAAWIRSLETRSLAPIIDPDIVGPADFVLPTTGTVYTTWNSRMGSVSGWKTAINATWTAGTPDQEAKFEDVINGHLASFTNMYEVWADLEEAGTDVKPYLEQYQLTYSEYLRLKEIQGLCVNDAADAEEQDELFNILTQVTKRREFAAWRDAEELSNIDLTPALFAPRPDAPIAFPPADPIPTEAWRYNSRTRRNWEKNLEARIDQEASITSGLEEVNEKTEDIALKLIRDAMISELPRSTNTPTDTADKPSAGSFESLAEWSHDRFLIDTKNDCCSKTNRVAMAIEALQGLLWGLRNDILDNDTANTAFYNWRLSASAFEEEWKWIGSYATWRAAVFVFLYPENISIPSLKRTLSPAFRKLVLNTQSNLRLNPYAACKEAETFSDYYEELCTLEVKASCQDMVGIGEEDACSRKPDPNASQPSGYRHYFFAQSNKGRIFWSNLDPRADQSTAQRQWELLPGLEEKKGLVLFGAACRDENHEKRYMAVFFREREDGEDKLRFIKYNRMDHSWGDVEELQLDVKALEEAANITGSGWSLNDFKVVVAQRMEDWHPMHIFLQLKSGVMFSAQLNDSISEVNWEGWKVNNLGNLKLKDKIQGYTADVLAIIWMKDTTTNANVYIGISRLYQSASGSKLSINAIHGDGTSLDHFEGWYNQTYLGAIPWNDSTSAWTWFGSDYPQQARIFTRLSGGAMSNKITVDNGKIVVSGVASCNDVERVATISGAWIGESRWIPVHLPKSTGQTRTLGKLVRVQFERNTSSDSLTIVGKTYSLRPEASSYFDIKSTYSSSQLQSRRAGIKAIVLDNKSTTSNIVPQIHQEVIREAYYFTPMQLGMVLSQRSHHTEALDWYKSVYDWSQPESDFQSDSKRKIWYGLVEDLNTATGFNRADDWLLDPLNPHQIASSRAFVYNKFTLLTIIRAMLAYADSMFTMDTSETVPKARLLYDQALELLALLKPGPGECADLIGNLDIELSDGYWQTVATRQVGRLSAISDTAILGTATTAIAGIIDGAGTDQAKAIAITSQVDTAMSSWATASAPVSMSTSLSNHTTSLTNISAGLMAVPSLQGSISTIATTSRNSLRSGIQSISGYSASTLSQRDNVSFAWLGGSGSLDLSGSAISFDTGLRDAMTQDEVNPSAFGAMMEYASDSPSSALSDTGTISTKWIPAPVYNFCIPPNPVIEGMCLRAELNLYKIRNCMNIAGMVRELDAFAAPTDTTSGLPVIGAGGSLQLPGTTYFRPTPYRYDILIDRAKQLVGIAQQIESSFLSALEKRDQEYYNQLKAKQDLELSKSQVKLQNLRVKEAESGVDLAKLQTDRSELQVDGLKDMIDEGLLASEQVMVGAYIASGLAQTAVAISRMVAENAKAAIEVAGAGGGTTAPASVAAAASAYIALNAATTVNRIAEVSVIATNVTGQVASVYASLERRKQEWEFQQSLAEQDVKIGRQQEKIAKDRVQIVGQERRISEMQVRHAESTLEFLTNKFTNAELYDWMSQELERVYQYFLQEATATAQMAQGQLAFQRQELPPPFIQGDYWEVPASLGASGDGEAPDRRGMTGSTRLLQDIYKLDQHAFNTDKRKLQIRRTLSLAELSPLEFQQMKQTGIMRFMTPMEIFDRDFPGHYLRLIKGVSISVVALVPPTSSIKATLTNTGLSRVVIGGDIFQTIYHRRDPELIALSATQNGNGLFDLRPDDKFLKPFESIGVDTTWEFRMEKAANQFDFETIADVLITIDYEAFNSFEHRVNVLNELGPDFSADLPISFKNNLPDQWYDLNNPSQTSTPMKVRFETSRSFFPPNLDYVSIKQLLLYFVFENGEVKPIDNVSLFFDEDQSLRGTYAPVAQLGGNAAPVDGIISTRSGSAGSWLSVIGKSVNGVWELSLPDTPLVKSYFENEELTDILFVITYDGEIPPYNL